MTESAEYDLSKMKFVEREAYDWACRRRRKDPDIDFHAVYLERLDYNKRTAKYHSDLRKARKKKTTARKGRPPQRHFGAVDTTEEPAFGKSFSGRRNLDDL